MGRKMLVSLVVIVAVLALNVGTQAGAAKQTEATITCAAYPGNTVIDWLPGQTSFELHWITATGFWKLLGVMKGGGKYATATPPGVLSWTATVGDDSLSGACT